MSWIGLIVVIFLSGYLIHQAGAESPCVRKCKAEDYRETGFNGKKRNATLRCLLNKMDADKDRIVTEKEFEDFKHTELKWNERPLAIWSIILMMCNCGCSRSIGFQDMLGSYKTCLKNDFQIDQAAKRLCMGYSDDFLPPADVTIP